MTLFFQMNIIGVILKMCGSSKLYNGSEWGSYTLLQISAIIDQSHLHVDLQ